MTLWLYRILTFLCILLLINAKDGCGCNPVDDVKGGYDSEEDTPDEDESDDTSEEDASDDCAPSDATSDGSFFETGQEADIVLSAAGFNDAGYLNTAGDGLLFHHPKGIATDGTHLLLVDGNNNRVLIWNSLPTANTSPDIVLGQPDLTENNTGSGLDEMNWPISVSTDGTKVVVADSYNDRILVWSTFPTSSGQEADFALEGDDIEWPWGVWTNGSRLIVGNTFKANVLMWGTFPEGPLEDADVTIEGPSELMGTPRTITTDGETFLMVGDHNPDESVIASTGDQGSFFWHDELPITDVDPDCYFGDPIDDNFAWLQGDVTQSGQLILLGSTLHIWDSVPGDCGESPSVSISDTGHAFEGGDGSDIAIADRDGDGTDDTVFVSASNENRVLVYNSIPTSDNDAPDFALGDDDLAATTLEEHYLITNPYPVCDGTNFYISSDYDMQILGYASYPTTSGQTPDFMIPLSYQPWQTAINSSYMVAVGKKVVGVWDGLPTSAADAPETFENTLGSASFGELKGVAIDDTYVYVADYQNDTIYVWEVGDLATLATGASVDPVAAIPQDEPSCLSSDGTYLLVANTNGNSVVVFRVCDIQAEGSAATSYAELGVGGGTMLINLPEHALAAKGHLFIADTARNRVFAWENLETVLESGGSISLYDHSSEAVIIGDDDINDYTPENGSERLFWPATLCYDGVKLWVGEYKFSGRLVGFTPR